MNPHPLETAALFGGRKYRSFVRQRHLRHPTTGCSVSPDPTADRVNEALARFLRSRANDAGSGFECSYPLVQQHKPPRCAVLMPNARRSTVYLIDDDVAFAKESVDCREDRILAGPDLPLTESYAQRTSSHAKSFCVLKYND
jgi:hypothetical protein